MNRPKGAGREISPSLARMRSDEDVLGLESTLHALVFVHHLMAGTGSEVQRAKEQNQTMAWVENS